MGCRKAVLWVISSRADLRAWYEGSCGYTATGETAPFPTGATVGAPRPGVALEFVRLVKALDLDVTADEGSWEEPAAARA